MTAVKEITDKYPSLYAAGAALNIHPQQLRRWIDAGALIDENGQVWIKTKGKIDTAA